MEFFPDFTSLTESFASIFFWSMAFTQLFWLIFFYARIAFHKEGTRYENFPISVIIAARNEEDNLFENLPYLLEQDYPNFEVIVVNHQSVDGTKFILNAYQKKYPHLSIINIEKEKHLNYGKKLPLTIGIKGAKHEHLIMTDADCKPASDQWIRIVAGKFSDKNKIVLGYAPYLKRQGLLNKTIRLDTTFIGLNYLSYAKAGLPYMGVGRNMAYTKFLFFENKGFKSHYSISSGDDDLFIQEAIKKRNYTITISPETFCYSAPKETWKEWLKQKSRHFTTAPRYPLFKRLLLGIYPLTLLFFYISFVTLVVNTWLNWVSLIVLVLVLILKWVILGLSFKKLDQKEMISGILLWDLFYAIFAPILYYTSEELNGKTWK